MIGTRTRPLEAGASQRGALAEDGELAVPRRRFVRGVIIAVLTALLVPLMLGLFTPAAHAENEDAENYSMYKLASNASSYFSEKTTPEKDREVHHNWYPITSNPATGGAFLGYADPEFSIADSVGWLYAEVSGSSQTILYDTFTASNARGDTENFTGMLRFSQFGMVNRDLGFDTMSTPMTGMTQGGMGGLMLLLYLFAVAASMLFWVVLQILKLTNPFGWFFQGVKENVGVDVAQGMTPLQGSGTLASLQNWIAYWYGILLDLAWGALVPLFLGFLIIGLVLFKRMDRGGAIKKFVVRLVFIGFGLPILGSMYTAVLTTFDDSMLGSHNGPTRVVLSTYVDFSSWMGNDRLAIPADATIAWQDGRASNDSVMNARRSALAINVQSHGSTFKDITVGSDKLTNAGNAFREGTGSGDCKRTIDKKGKLTDSCGEEGSAGSGADTSAVATTVGMLTSHITSERVSASDFESGIKSEITGMPNAKAEVEERAAWFSGEGDKGYSEVKEFGEVDPDPEDALWVPYNNPIFATTNNAPSGDIKGVDSLRSTKMQGLTAKQDGQKVVFTTSNLSSATGCGYEVISGSSNYRPGNCNLSPLASFNYLNAQFDQNSVTMFSSNKAASGFVRSDHMAVSQVGTGAGKFVYYANALVTLGCIAVLGIWYAIGALIASIKRTFSLIAAIPFATLGAIQAIAKVIVYSIAMILEVIVTLFIYQFASEFLVSIPDVVSSPISMLATKSSLFGSFLFGGQAVLLMTAFSTVVLIGVTIAMLKARKTVMQGLDEMISNVVNKFLDTSVTPNPGKGGRNLMPALASGAGTAAGLAGAKGLGDMLQNRGTKSPSGGQGGNTPSGDGPGQNNAGGTNGSSPLRALGTGRDGEQAQRQLAGGTSPAGLLGQGSGQGGDGPDGKGPHGPGGRVLNGNVLEAGSDGKDGSAGGGAAGQDGDDGADGQDGQSLEGSAGAKGDQTNPAGSISSAKDTAQALEQQGGLSNLGYTAADGSIVHPPAPASKGAGGKGSSSTTEETTLVMEQGADGVYGATNLGGTKASSTGAPTAGAPSSAPAAFGLDAQQEGAASSAEAPAQAAVPAGQQGPSAASTAAPIVPTAPATSAVPAGAQFGLDAEGQQVAAPGQTIAGEIVPGRAATGAPAAPAGGTTAPAPLVGSGQPEVPGSGLAQPSTTAPASGTTSTSKVGAPVSPAGRPTIAGTSGQGAAVTPGQVAEGAAVAAPVISGALSPQVAQAAQLGNQARQVSALGQPVATGTPSSQAAPAQSAPSWARIAQPTQPPVAAPTPVQPQAPTPAPAQPADPRARLASLPGIQPGMHRPTAPAAPAPVPAPAAPAQSTAAPVQSLPAPSASIPVSSFQTQRAQAFTPVVPTQGAQAPVTGGAALAPTSGAAPVAPRSSGVAPAAPAVAPVVLPGGSSQRPVASPASPSVRPAAPVVAPLPRQQVAQTRVVVPAAPRAAAPAAPAPAAAPVRSSVQRKAPVFQDVEDVREVGGSGSRKSAARQYAPRFRKGQGTVPGPVPAGSSQESTPAPAPRQAPAPAPTEAPESVGTAGSPRGKSRARRLVGDAVGAAAAETVKSAADRRLVREEMRREARRQEREKQRRR